MESIVKIIIAPSGFALFCLFVAFGILLSEKYRKIGLALIAISGLILIPMSTGTVATLLLSPLEYHYPVMEDAGKHADVKKIVVLTGAAEDEPQWPLSSRLNSSSAYRLLEAHRIFQACTDCQIYISGNEVCARLMKQLLVSMNVPGDQIHEDGKSLHTYDSAVTMKKLLHSQKVILVTSAGHMPRAMGVFKKQGMFPIPAPTDFMLPRDFRKASISPSPLHLFWSDLAVREYEALFWYRITDKI